MQAQQNPVLTAKPGRSPLHRNFVQFVRLHSLNDLGWYQQRYHTASGSLMSLEYLAHSNIYVAYHQGRIVGGFVINANGRLRYLEPFSDEQMAEFSREFGIQFDQTAEITGIWLEARSKTHFTRIQVYCASLWFAILSGKKFVLGGAKTEAIVRLYRQIMTINLFTGQVTDRSGHSFTSYLYFQTRSQVILNAGRWLLREYTGKLFHTRVRKPRLVSDEVRKSAKPTA